jgi:hypothetical protein
VLSPGGSAWNEASFESLNLGGSDWDQGSRFGALGVPNGIRARRFRALKIQNWIRVQGFQLWRVRMIFGLEVCSLENSELD